MIAHVVKALSSMTVVSLSTKDRLGGLFLRAAVYSNCNTTHCMSQ